MSVANSLVSIDMDDASVIDSTILSRPNEGPPVCGDTCPRRPGRRRWMFRLRKPSSVERMRFKGLTISCRCRSAVKGSCLILISAFVELIGCLTALGLGLCYIQNAYNFYELEADPATRAGNYDEKLERVLYIEKNRVGFVGLLATCIIGLLISILMPIGTLYRSWKCLRVSMTLLFSVCLMHLLVLFIYLPTSILMTSIVAVLFRMVEFIFILNFIKYYKRKKLEEIKEKAKQAGRNLATEGTSTQHLLDNSSICSKEDLMEFQKRDLPEITIDPLNQPYLDTIALEASANTGGLVLNLNQVDMIKKSHRRDAMKRKFLDHWKKEERPYQKAPKYDAYLLYEMPK